VVGQKEAALYLIYLFSFAKVAKKSVAQTFGCSSEKKIKKKRMAMLITIDINKKRETPEV